LAEIFLTQLAIEQVCYFPPHPTSAFALPGEIRASIIRVKMNLWPPTAGLLQSLTVMQQCVYQIQFRNVCEIKKRLVQPGLVWSRTLSILLSMNGESVSLPVFA